MVSPGHLESKLHRLEQNLVLWVDNIQGGQPHLTTPPVLQGDKLSSYHSGLGSPNTQVQSVFYNGIPSLGRGSEGVTEGKC